ncbi:factor associated with metabolism and energy isoform X2 [Carettochelys insculpta]|uniref:factor associated with metabolism and energy isoform X2 n=1 Tax=Carettochelys insculpta TaxID=44489 RepID=UPI003EBE280D
MGLSYSRAHHKVTKVAPAQTKEEAPTSPCTAGVYGFHGSLEERSFCSFAAMEERNPLFQRQLPPLRETRYGRCSTVPRPISFDIMLEKGETSIIKQHPPRRLQKLVPADLPPVIASEKLLSQQEGAAARKAKMNHLQRQEELKRRLHREPKVSKQKPRELQAKEILGNLQQNNCSEGEDLVPIEHDQTFNGDPGNAWDGEFLAQHDKAESYPSRSSKVEMWFVKHRDPRDLFWDSSSTDSDDWKREERKLGHRPALVRTKTERIPLFDEFFDTEF